MAFYGRGKNKIQNPYTMQDFYKTFKDKVEKDSPYDVEYSAFRDVLELYFKGIRDLILEESRSFRFPCNLGEIKIAKKKINFAKMYPSSIDWVNTVKHGKILYHLNEHSDNYKYLFMWNRANARLKNISKYKFVPVRSNKRKLAYYIKNKLKDYFEV